MAIEAPAPGDPAEDPVKRARALKIAEHLCEIAFRGRKGHGALGTVVYRQLRRGDFMAFMIAAFEAGADWESKR